MFKSTIIAYFIAAALIAVPAFDVAHAAPGTGESLSSTAPGTGASLSSTGGTAPATGDSTSSAGTSAPGTGGSTSSAGNTAPGTGDSTSSAGPADDSVDTTDPDEDRPRRRSSGGSRVATSGSVNSNLVILSDSCPLITSYMKIDAVNDAAQVAKLQAFLKNSEQLDLEVNGIFDVKTEAAVRAFQTKYATSVLGPWDANQSTGIVYITTSKKINELACATPISLSADEQAIIAAYKQNISTQSNGVAPIDTTTPGSLDVGSTDQESNVAAVGQSSIASRFWDFIKNLFR